MAKGAAGNLGGGLGKFTELRQRLLFVVGALIVYRIGCYIPVPGVNPEAMLQLMESQKGTIVDMFNMFSGGALSRFSLFALNVVPYISASIVVQLMTQILPSWKAMSKEGESGRRKITQYSRALSAWPSSRLPASLWRCRARARRTAFRSYTTRAPDSC
jgi:preprotein translocase subunit SecY